MKRFGGLVIFDYAATAPYVKIDMRPEEGLEIDAICLSTHKFVGGPETPGLLIFKQSLFSNSTPIFPSKESLLYMTTD